MNSHEPEKGLAIIIVSESARPLKRFIEKTGLNRFAQAMVPKMMLTFMTHRGRMSCSQAAGSVASESAHRGQLTRFLARPRWQKQDFNAALREALLQLESGKGKFLFLIDATLVKLGPPQATHFFEQKESRGRREKQEQNLCALCLLLFKSSFNIPQLQKMTRFLSLLIFFYSHRFPTYFSDGGDRYT